MARSPKIAREKDIEKMCIEIARMHGVHCQKTHSGAIMLANFGGGMRRINLCDQGTPDITACYMGRYLGIEIKDSQEEIDRWWRVIDSYLATGDSQHTRTIKPSWDREVCQYLQHESIRAAGGLVIICSSPEELVADLQQLRAEWEAKDEIIKRVSNSLPQKS